MNHTQTPDSIRAAYTYGYPIVGMYELLNAQLLDPKTKTSAFGEFAHTAALSTPETAFIPAPNNDTTYSRAWVDLRQGPVVIQTPDTAGRFFSIQLLDLYSETVANLGKRLYGTDAASYVLVGPGYTGPIPAGGAVIHCNTVFVLAFLRILIGDESQLPTVKALQSHFLIKAPAGAGETANLPPYKNENAKEFFETLAAVLALSPPLPGEENRLEEARTLAALPVEELDPPCREILAHIDEKGLTFGENVNHWRVARKGIGTYKTDYLQRAVVWFKGALANVPEESFYPSTFQDEMGETLMGDYHYRLHFPAGELPPVSQFWSLTMYLFKNGFLVPNPINRYSLGDRTEGMIHGPDGSLTIFIQPEEPTDPNQRANWLPAPKGEPFYLTLRLYGPSQAAVEGEWTPPPVQKV